MSLILPEKRQRKPPKSGITALIDLDILTYSIGFACQKTIYEVTIVGEQGPRYSFESKKEMKEGMEGMGLDWQSDVNINTRIEPEPISNCLHSVKVFMEGVLEATNAEFYKGYLTGKGNFRDELATIQVYKGNRTAAKPVHFKAIREYLIAQWGAIVSEGMEADDLLSIEQYKDLGDFK